MVAGLKILLCEAPHLGPKLHFRKWRGQQQFWVPVLLGNIREQVIDGSRSYRGKHLRVVFIGVGYVRRYEGMIGQREFNLMKQNAILINTSRGQVVDQQSLYKALKTQRISGAALDVTSLEPIPKDDPLLELKNVVISPHIATATHKTRLTMAIIAKDNLISGLNKSPLPHCVNPEVYSQWTDRSL